MFLTALVWVASFVLAFSLFKPKMQNNIKPAGLDDFNIPTASIGREIPVVFGTRDIKSANVVWYGGLRVVPIKKKGGKK
ncbi:MAG: hypothetical protein KGV56_05080 [Gammaproteobacteria bacterium]|nr:hypothetical protein [Gammaproteobacteria bacterium]